MRLRHAVLAAAAAFSPLLVVACGDDDGDDAGSATTIGAVTIPATLEPQIVISGFAFKVSPAPAGTITIRNDDSTAHTVTADDGSFSVSVEGGETATIEIAAAGSYAFHCNFHSSMTGTLVVA
jgi:plastocyanin